MRKLRILVTHPLTILSVLAAVAVYLWSVEQNADQSTAVLLSLQPVIVGLVLEIWWETLVSRDLAAEYWDLFRQKQRSPNLFRFVEQIVQLWSDANVAGIPMEPIRRLIQERFNRFTSEIELFSARHARFEKAEWFGIDIDMMSCAHREVLAVSHAESSTIWDTGGGKKYWSINEERIKKFGVACTRVFIFPTDNLSQEDRDKVERIMKVQRAAGANIFIADKGRLDARLTRDLVIVDRLVCSRLVWTSSGERVGNELTWDPKDIEAAVRDFEILVSSAMTFDEYFDSSVSATRTSRQ